VVHEDDPAFFVRYDVGCNRERVGHALALGLRVRF
jgi:hypothetical protein